MPQQILRLPLRRGSPDSRWIWILHRCSLTPLLRAVDTVTCHHGFNMDRWVRIPARVPTFRVAYHFTHIRAVLSPRTTVCAPPNLFMIPPIQRPFLLTVDFAHTAQPTFWTVCICALRTPYFVLLVSFLAFASWITVARSRTNVFFSTQLLSFVRVRVGARALRSDYFETLRRSSAVHAFFVLLRLPAFLPRAVCVPRCDTLRTEPYTRHVLLELTHSFLFFFVTAAGMRYRARLRNTAPFSAFLFRRFSPPVVRSSVFRIKPFPAAFPPGTRTLVRACVRSCAYRTFTLAYCRAFAPPFLRFCVLEHWCNGRFRFAPSRHYLRAPSPPLGFQGLLLTAVWNGGFHKTFY